MRPRISIRGPVRLSIHRSVCRSHIFFSRVNRPEMLTKHNTDSAQLIHSLIWLEPRQFKHNGHDRVPNLFRSFLGIDFFVDDYEKTAILGFSYQHIPDFFCYPPILQRLRIPTHPSIGQWVYWPLCCWQYSHSIAETSRFLAAAFLALTILDLFSK